MSGNLIDLRRRINSVKNTQKVTRAMKTVSAAKLRRNVSDLNRNRPYIDKIKYLLSKMKNEVKVEVAPFLKKRDEGDTILIVLSSDKGLCGSFNSNIITKAVDYYGQLKEKEENIEESVDYYKKALLRYLKKGIYNPLQAVPTLIPVLAPVHRFAYILREPPEKIYSRHISVSHLRGTLQY